MKIIALILIALIVIVGAGLYYYFYMYNTAPPAVQPLKLGGTQPFTGGLSANSHWAIEATDMWVDQINKAGGWLGRPVVLVRYDDKSDAATAAAMYEKLITQDDVDILLAPYGTSQTIGGMAIAEQYKIPFISYQSTSYTLNAAGYKYLLNVQPAGTNPNEGQLKPFFDWIMSQNPKPTTAAVLSFTGSDYSKDHRAAAKKMCAERNITVLVDEAYNDQQTDMIPIMTKVRDSGAEILLGCGLLPDGVNSIKAASQLGVKFKAIYNGFSRVPEFAAALGSLGQYVTSHAIWFARTPWINYPGSQEFTTEYIRRYVNTPGDISSMLWVSLEVLYDAVTATHAKYATTIDYEKLMQYMLSHTFETIEGPVSFDSKGIFTGPVRLTMLMGSTFNTTEIIWPLADRTATPPYPANKP